jgi:hypothetical protein
MHNSGSADGYAYAWWNKTFSVQGRDFYSYSAQGWGGQMIYVFPALNAVIVFTAGYWVSGNPINEILESYILPSMI